MNKEPRTQSAHRAITRAPTTKVAFTMLGSIFSIMSLMHAMIYTRLLWGISELLLHSLASAVVCDRCFYIISCELFKITPLDLVKPLARSILGTWFVFPCVTSSARTEGPRNHVSHGESIPGGGRRGVSLPGDRNLQFTYVSRGFFLCVEEKQHQQQHQQWSVSAFDPEQQLGDPSNGLV